MSSGNLLNNRRLYEKKSGKKTNDISPKAIYRESSRLYFYNAVYSGVYLFYHCSNDYVLILCVLQLQHTVTAELYRSKKLCQYVCGPKLLSGLVGHAQICFYFCTA